MKRKFNCPSELLPKIIDEAARRIQKSGLEVSRPQTEGETSYLLVSKFKSFVGCTFFGYTAQCDFKALPDGIEVNVYSLEFVTFIQTRLRFPLAYELFLRKRILNLVAETVKDIEAEARSQ